MADIPSFYMNKISFGPKARQGPGRIRFLGAMMGLIGGTGA